MAAVAKIDPPQVPATRTAPTPMDLLTQAVANGNLELAEKLMGLQERWERNQNRKAFDNALAEAKKELPIIVKDNQVSFGTTNYKYEDLASISKAIDSILAKHGLSYRFRSKGEPGTIIVTCILSHRDGHSEENSLPGPVDTSGGKNAIQGIGSSCTYLSRYTLKMSLGLAASKDDDANSINLDKITDQQFEDLISLADEVGADKIKFAKYMKIASLADLPASKINEAVAALESKRKAK